MGSNSQAILSPTTCLATCTIPLPALPSLSCIPPPSPQVRNMFAKLITFLCVATNNDHPFEVSVTTNAGTGERMSHTCMHVQVHVYRIAGIFQGVKFS